MERVPASEYAVVAESKIRGYLLSTEHPFGRFKAQFFLEFGFRLDAWMEMQESLLRHVQENRVVDREVTEFGIKYGSSGNIGNARKRVHDLEEEVGAARKAIHPVGGRPTRRIARFAPVALPGVLRR